MKNDNIVAMKQTINIPTKLKKALVDSSLVSENKCGKPNLLGCASRCLYDEFSKLLSMIQMLVI